MGNRYDRVSISKPHEPRRSVLNALPFGWSPDVAFSILGAVSALNPIRDGRRIGSAGAPHEMACRDRFARDCGSLCRSKRLAFERRHERILFAPDAEKRLNLIASAREVLQDAAGTSHVRAASTKRPAAEAAANRRARQKAAPRSASRDRRAGRRPPHRFLKISTGGRKDSDLEGFARRVSATLAPIPTIDSRTEQAELCCE